METLLKKPPIIRDDNGRFERHGKTLSKTAKKGEIKIGENTLDNSKPNKGRGRPPGAKNKASLVLREAILQALDKVGGADYLSKLAIENSSAFASLLKGVLPKAPDTSETDGGKPATITFQRIIVYPDGHKHIEGVTPRQIAPPTSHTLPSEDVIEVESNEIKDLE